MELRDIDISDKQQVLGFFMSEPNPDKNGRMKREETFARLFPELYSEFKDFAFSADLTPQHSFKSYGISCIMITGILAFAQCAENARSFSRSHSDTLHIARQNAPMLVMTKKIKLQNRGLTDMVVLAMLQIKYKKK